MIAIIDYGMGNLRSVQKAFEHVGHRAVVTRDPRVVDDASRVVLPGVGAFRDCMGNLKSLGLAETVLRAIEKGKPFLGICLGLQLLFGESEEFGRHQGLGVIPGRVVRFPDPLTEGGERLKVPHMGWNTIDFQKRPPVFEDVVDHPHVYFVHSYYVMPQDTAVVAATTSYGVEFVSAVWKDNIVATQFHPEKSQTVGLAILRRFGEWA